MLFQCNFVIKSIHQGDKLRLDSDCILETNCARVVRPFFNKKKHNLGAWGAFDVTYQKIDNISEK